MTGNGAGKPKLLKALLFMTGIGEFLTGVVMLFFTDLAKAIYGMPLDSDPFWLHQVGMFNLLVGAFMTLGAFRVKRITYVQFTLYFHAISLVFEAWMGLVVLGPSESTWLPTILFLAYHVVMTPLLLWAMRKSAIPVV